MLCITNLCNLLTVFPPRIKKKGGGGGFEHLEAVYAVAHTLLAYITTILCCVNALWGSLLAGISCTAQKVF